MLLRPRNARTRTGLFGLAAGAWIAGYPLSTSAQEPATSGVTPPDGPVTTVNDPLRARSATENTVFGRIVSTDEHRLTLVEGEGDEGTQVEFISGPGVKVFIDERPARLADIPANARIKVYRDPEDRNVITDVVVLQDEPTTDEPDTARSTSSIEDSTSPVGFGLILEGTPKGLMVASVRVDGPADKAGIQAGDEIVTLDEVPVGAPRDILDATAEMEDGATVTVTIRRDGTERTVSLIAERGPAGKDSVRTTEASPQPTEVLKGDAPEVATEVVKPVELSATLATDTKGIAVVRIDRNSPLAKAGLKDGDLIQQAAGKNVLTPESLFRVLNEFDGGTNVELVVLRDGEEMSFTLELPEGHERVLVDTSETSTHGAVNPDFQRYPNGDRMGQASVQELQAIVARQQEQIDWLYNALMQTASATGVATNGWGAFPAGFAGGFGFNGAPVDANGDGVPDQDTNGDGIIDEDLDGDGVIDDVNGDGVRDRDIDSDGILDVDLDGDGVIDPSGQTPPDTTPMDRLPGRETDIDVPVPPNELPELRNGNRNRQRTNTTGDRPHPEYIGPPVRQPGSNTRPGPAQPGTAPAPATPPATGGAAPGATSNLQGTP